MTDKQAKGANTANTAAMQATTAILEVACCPNELWGIKMATHRMVVPCVIIQ